MAQFKDLLVFGNTRVLGTVYATNFDGLATKATADKNGKDITTYLAGLSAEDNVITFTDGAGTTDTITTHEVWTTWES